jgi:hypothetical protein
VSTTEELLERKSSGSGLENREYCSRGSASVVCPSKFLATDSEIRVRFPELSDFLRSNGSGTGLRFPHFPDNRLADGGDVSFMLWTAAHKYSWYSFLLEAESIQELGPLKTPMASS